MPQLLNNFLLHQYALGYRVWAGITRYLITAGDAACSAYDRSGIVAWTVVPQTSTAICFPYRTHYKMNLCMHMTFVLVLTRLCQDSQVWRTGCSQEIIYHNNFLCNGSNHINQLGALIQHILNCLNDIYLPILCDIIPFISNIAVTMMMYCAGVRASSHPLWVVWAVVCWVILTCMWWV